MFRSVATNFASLPSALQKGEGAGVEGKGGKAFLIFFNIVFVRGIYFHFQ